MTPSRTPEILPPLFLRQNGRLFSSPFSPTFIPHFGLQSTFSRKGTTQGCLTLDPDQPLPVIRTVQPRPLTLYPTVGLCSTLSKSSADQSQVSKHPLSAASKKAPLCLGRFDPGLLGDIGHQGAGLRVGLGVDHGPDRRLHVVFRTRNLPHRVVEQGSEAKQQGNG